MKNDLLKIFVVSGVVIKQDSKYLLVQEKKPIVYGLWNLPAGHVESNESLENAAIRETKEETGFDVKLLREIGIFHGDGDKTVKHVFEAEIIGGKLKYPKEEILDAKWFSCEEINNMKDKLRTSWIIEVVDILKEREID